MAHIFISYSHQDESWKNRLVKQLGVLAAEGLETWNDRRIAAGDDWLPEIERAIASCDLALLLISANFLTSKFILGQEVPVLLQRRQEQGLRVIPVILSPCQWQRISWLKVIQARPKDGKPLSGMTKHNADDALSALAGEIHDLLFPRSLDAPPFSQPSGPLRSPRPTGEGPGVRVHTNTQEPSIDLTHLPKGADHFLGRVEELAWLDAAWKDPQARLVELIAPGGTGKTALVKRWLDRLGQDGWRGAQRVYAWSFYSQGTGADRQASDDHFLGEALAWFGVKYDTSLSPWDKGRKLAEVVAATRALLVLDGVEPLQYPPGPLAGELRATGLKALLTQLASAGQSGRCLLTSREQLTDLDEYARSAEHPVGGVLRRDLGNLTPNDGAHLLHALGVCEAGAATIERDDAELKAASRAVRGHALTLSLLGRYLALGFGGDIRRRDQVNFREADAETQNGHAFRLMAAYETWFKREGEQGARELAALRLLGFFDRPASPESLAALRAAPLIPGLTESLVDLRPAQWRITLKRLEDCGLIYPSLDPHPGPLPAGEGASLDAHPLIRQYLADSLRKHQPEAWREGHRRLYEQLKASVPHRPEGLAALQPLYQAVAHGCWAGLYQETCNEVYKDRILRGAEHDGYYSSKKLGAFGADLGAVACFFVEPWRRLTPSLSEDDQAWLLAVAAFNLRALSRLDEALEPMWAGAEMRVKQEDWTNAAIGYSNLSELQLILGRVIGVVDDAGQAVAHADRSGDAFMRVYSRTTLADARHQRGELETAEVRFVEAEALQAEDQPEHPLLYSLQGFRYGDLLLARVERAAWRGPVGDEALLRRCGEVAERTRGTQRAWREICPHKPSLLNIALGQLTLARCALYGARLRGEAPTTARVEAERAVADLRASGSQHHLPRGLLTRAWLRHCLGDTAGAEADLQEVEQIAKRGQMRLHLADCHLTRARLFRDRDELAKARALIEECEYWRRLPELEDAEAALNLSS